VTQVVKLSFKRAESINGLCLFIIRTLDICYISGILKSVQLVVISNLKNDLLSDVLTLLIILSNQF